MSETALMEVLGSAKAIAWDTCHKIYIAMDDEQVEKLIEYGYEGDMLTSNSLTPEEMYDTLLDWWDNACFLRFIQSVTTTADPNDGYVDVIAQGEDWIN